MTHDSIGLGEDGPTHQPVEHLAALRAIPNLLVFRPCDAVETAECWQLALEARETPERAGADPPEPAAAAHRAGRATTAAPPAPMRSSPADGAAQVSIFATGSEVAIAVEARKLLRRTGVPARVVSVPCFELFLDAARRLPPKPSSATRRCKVAVEAAHAPGLGRASSAPTALFVGMTGFGASAPYKDLYKHFGITAEAVAEAALSKLGKSVIANARAISYRRS